MTIMPTSAVKWPQINIKKADLQMIGAENIAIYHPEDSVGVPKFRQLPDFYRSRLAACKKKIGKMTKKVIRSPDDLQRGHSESDEEPPAKVKKSKRQEDIVEIGEPIETDSDAVSTPKMSEEESDDDWSD